MNELEVKINKVISAPIEKVFDAWLNPLTLSKFMQPMAGMSDAEVINNPKVGGRFTIVMVASDNKMSHEGEYIEINRPNKLVFTWETTCSAVGSTVTLDFSEIDSTHTRIDLLHSRFIDEEARANHEGGWTGIFGTLADTI